MKTTVRLLTMVVLLCSASKAMADDFSFRLRNSLGWQRTEVVKVSLPEGFDANGKKLVDEQGRDVAFCQADAGSSIVFEAEVAAGSTSGYVLSEGTGTTPTKRTYAALKVPSSRNDIAWENDMAAYRMYSSVLLKNEPNTANGVDLWQKKKQEPVIDAMYGLSYHNESEYGVDAYSVNGKKLGVGGLGAYVDGHLVLHDPFDDCRIVENGPLHSEFVLTFNNVVIDGATYTKTLRIETTAGRMLNKATVRLEGSDKPVKLAIAIYTHEDMNLTTDGVNYTSVAGLAGRAENKSEGTVTSSNVRFFEGAYTRATAETKVVDNHLCLLVDYQPGTELVYYFGGGWNVFPQGLYAQDSDWFEALTMFKAEEENPLVVTSVTTLPRKDEVRDAIELANNYWQTNHSARSSYFWNWAVYHVGNMEAYKTLGTEAWRQYSEDWAEYNKWKGATADNWNYTYGEQNVLFGDCQICFQVYADLYNLAPEERKIARALEVMGHQVETENVDYWWWVDGLFMVMPVMTKLYHITGNDIYLEKMHQYWQYANSLMYDEETGLYFRDANYVFPAHKTNSGKKDFWARGDGWIFAAFARILNELPADHQYRDEYISYYRKMAATLKQHQQADGYWTRSIIDPDYAPGCETSGTALMTYGYAWGINNGVLDETAYGEVLERAWNYLSKTALQADGKVGYVQPIGSNAAAGTTISASQTADFGVGAFLLACSELYKYAGDNPTPRELRLSAVALANSYTLTLSFNVPVSIESASDLSHYQINGEPVEGDVEVDGRMVNILLHKILNYGRYTVEANGLVSTEGAGMEQPVTRTIVSTVPIYANTLITKVTASGNQSGNTPQNTIDNNISTRWSHDGKGQWLQLELAEPTELCAVDVSFYQGATRQSYFDVQLSLDGKTFDTLLSDQASSGTTNELERYAFTSQTARYVRLVCNGNSQGGANWNSITEVRVVPADMRTVDELLADIALPRDVYTDILLPAYTTSGEVIRWISDNNETLSTSGLVTLPETTETIGLTAVTIVGRKTFDITVHARDISQNQMLCYAFEPADVYTQDGQTYVRDLSKHHRDAKIMGKADIDGTLNLTRNTATGFATNGYAIVPEHTLDSLRSYTFLLTCTPKSLTSQPRIYDFGGNTSNSIFLRANVFSAGCKYMGGTTRLIDAGQSLAVNQTHHIAVSFDASSQVTSIYVDGELTVQKTTIQTEPYQLTRIISDSRNYIGRGQWWDSSVASDNQDFRGTIDNFMLYDIALSGDEIVHLQSADPSTEIASVHNENPNVATAAYDLLGRRVQHNEFKKGIYLINGKKIVK